MTAAYGVCLNQAIERTKTGSFMVWLKDSEPRADLYYLPYLLTCKKNVGTVLYRG